ncbi:MAG: DUF6973 domain-containing protein [Pontibacterium sp.]
MRLSSKPIIFALISTITLGLYPAFVLSYTWANVATAEFEGGKNGQLDAYRHTLASAVVSYTLNADAVALVTRVMERNQSGPNLMDKHNNELGAALGQQAPHFLAIEPLVAKYVALGAVNTANPEQVTWLPQKRWSESILW